MLSEYFYLFGAQSCFQQLCYSMLPSPTKSVRFQKAAPLKGVLKKPEVVVSV